ncbi:MAG: hypothetical protein JSR46_04265 [Verrucomicrobia bacterium]|nr:hypothetical protein [Verrucomicrobiota bacterium]
MRGFHKRVWIEDVSSDQLWVQEYLDEENGVSARFVGKYHYGELLPRELWTIVFIYRAALSARTALAPAVYVLRRFRQVIESSWSNGSPAYTELNPCMVKDKQYFSTYLFHHKAPQVMWNRPPAPSGNQTVELQVPDHPFCPFRVKDEKDFEDCVACSGTPMEPNPDCSVCSQLVDWSLALTYGEMLLWERPLWVLKKLGMNGSWPGWEDTPLYLQTLEAVGRESATWAEQYLSVNSQKFSLPDIVQPTFAPKQVLSSKWQPIIALSVILDLVMQAPLEGKQGGFSASNVVWESPPWIRALGLGYEQPFFADPDLNPESLRTLGFSQGTSIYNTPYVTQYLTGGGTHSASSVRNHRVINQFGEMRNYFLREANDEESEDPIQQCVTSHTWYFAEDGYQQQPDCPFNVNVPKLHGLNNQIFLENSKLRGAAIFDALEESGLDRSSISLVRCPGKCFLNDVHRQTITHNTTSALPINPPLASFDQGNAMSWSMVSGRSQQHCYGVPIYDRKLGVLVQEDAERLRNRAPVHTCLNWRVSNRMKQILPVCNNPHIRYIEGQLPLAMSLFEAAACEITDAVAEVPSVDTALLQAFVNHSIFFEGQQTSGPHLLAKQFGLASKRLIVIWDRVRPMAVARADVVDHVRTNRGFANLIWSESSTMPFLLAVKKSDWSAMNQKLEKESRTKKLKKEYPSLF